MKKKILSIIIVLLSLLLFTLIVFRIKNIILNKNANNNITNSLNNVKDIANSTQEQVKEKYKIFYFWNSALIGIVENKKFNKGNLTYQDIFSQNEYSAYNLNGDKEIINSIFVSDSRQYDKTSNEDSTIMEYFSNTGKIERKNVSTLDNNYDEIKINLPLKIPNEIANKEIANNDINLNNYGDILNMNVRGKPLLTNSNIELDFSQLDKNKELSKNIEDYVQNYILKNNLNKDLSYTCTNKYITDFDKDNKSEYIYVIQTHLFEQNNDNNYWNSEIKKINETGALSLVLFERNDGAIISLLQSYIKPNTNSLNEIDFLSDNIYGWSANLNIALIDIDFDNTYEIVLSFNNIYGESEDHLQIYDYTNDNLNLITDFRHTFQ